MKNVSLLIVAMLSSVAALTYAQAPEIASAAKVGTSDTVRLRFNVPITPAGTTTLLEDDFSGETLDTALWRINMTPFEPGGSTSGESSVVQADGQLTIEVVGENPGWGGISLATVESYTASENEPLVFEVDRVAHDEDGSATRTGIWITDETRSHYILFSENEGGGGWQYNRLTEAEGDIPFGNGAITPLVNGEEFNDLDTHRIKAVVNGATVQLYLDDLFATEIPFPFGNGIVFEFGAYAAETGDLVTGVFDNARVSRMTAATVSNFTINNGATVTAVTATLDPQVLELTTTGVNAGSDYTLTVSGVTGADGTVVDANSTVTIQTGEVNSTYAAAVLADEPLVYYPMDANEGTAVPNLGSNGTEGTYVSQTGPVITAGPGLPDFPGFDAGNTAALFDGTGTYTDDEDLVQLPGVGNYIDTGAPLLLDLPQFTIEAWIRPANLDEIRLGIAGTFGTEFGFSNPGEIHIYTGGGGIIYAPYPFPYHEWHHIVVAGDGTNLTIYADGEVLAEVEEETDNYGGEDRNVFIGGGGIFDDVLTEGFGNWFPGGIDEMAIYDKALSAERVKAHFNAAFAVELHPTITITSPTENASIEAGTAVPITVQTGAAAGRTVSRVEFFDRNTELGESTTSPFSFEIPSIIEGRHTFTAKVYDDLGVWTISDPVRFTVGEPMPLIVMVVASTDNPTESDEEVRAHLAERGFDVQLVQASRLSEADVAEAALVVVPVVRADSVAATLRELPVPILTWDQDLQPTFLFTEDEVDVFWGDTAPDLYINLVNPTHPLSAEIPEGVIPVNEFPQEFAWGVPTSEATVIATLADEPERAVIYAYEQGATLVDGSEAPEKRVFFMLTDDTFLALNEDGRKLFDAAVTWALRTVEPMPQFNPATVEGENLVLSWTGGGTLQAADTVTGEWEDVPEAESPHSVPLSGGSRFFRIVR